MPSCSRNLNFFTSFTVSADYLISCLWSKGNILGSFTKERLWHIDQGRIRGQFKIFREIIMGYSPRQVFRGPECAWKKGDKVNIVLQNKSYQWIKADFGLIVWDLGPNFLIWLFYPKINFSHISRLKHNKKLVLVWFETYFETE